MSWRNRVVWSQGMYLQPHHFQQEGRYVEQVLDARLHGAHPYAWGFEKLVVDEAALALGKFALSEAVGVLPDGTTFFAPSLDPLPAPLEVPGDLRDEAIVLAAPIARAGAVEFDFDNAEPLARYSAAELATRDATSAADSGTPIQVGRLRLRLLRAREATDAYATLACARIEQRRPDGQVVTQREFIPPQSRLNATPHLVQIAVLLQGLLAQRADALSGRMGQLGHGVSEVAHFMMLELFNRHEPVFSQYARLGNAHPQRLYESCLMLAGEFATFVAARRRPSAYPVYQHDNPGASFAPLIAELREMFSRGIEESAQEIPLADRGYGIRTAAIADLQLVRKGTFVVAVNAQVPSEQLRTRFLSQAKVGPVEKIKDLVTLQLPGIAMNALPVAPRQLPYHAGFFYFELDRSGELWKQLEKTGNLALHVAGDFPGLQMQLWAIRN
jgi:type VI secretion system protein ImpJ